MKSYYIIYADSWHRWHDNPWGYPERQFVTDTIAIIQYINDLSGPKHRLSSQVGDNAAASKLIEITPHYKVPTHN